MDHIYDNYGLYLVVIGILMLLSAFFSGTETAVVTSNRVFLDNLARKGNRNAARALAMLDTMDETVSMLLIGNNIVNISSAALVTYLATRAFLLDERGLFIVTIVQAVIFLIFCEVTPKIFARALAERHLMFFATPVRILMALLLPARKTTVLITGALLRLIGIGLTDHARMKSRDEIVVLFRIGEEDGVIDLDHQRFITEMLSFKHITVREIMTPTIDIVSIEAGQGIRELAGIVANTKFSRIPVYENRVDNIIGYIHYRDLLKKRQAKRAEDLMQKVHYIPMTKKVSEIYADMQEKLIPVYFVVNEYGAVVGMVTHEDIAEEVVGEIQTRDQFDDDLITEISKRKFVISATLDIEYFMRKFKVEIEKKGFETVAGFLSYNLGRIPRKGDRFKYDRFTFIIEEATERSVEKVIVKLSGRG